MVYNLLINGVYWGYNPLTNHLLTSWDIQVTLTRWANEKRFFEVISLFENGHHWAPSNWNVAKKPGDTVDVLEIR